MIRLTQETRAGWHVVGVQGRADSEAADELEGALRAAVEAHPKVAADCAALDYISSAGLRALLQAARAAQNCHAEFAVCSPNPRVQRVFDMSGMQHLLRIYGDLPC